MVQTLPHIDELSRQVDAPPGAVWMALERWMRGWPLRRGFHVEQTRPGERLALAGHHPFARYELVFEIEDLGGGRSRLRAITNAAFPGPHGRVYRALVIGSGGHRVLARRMLDRIAARARG